MFRGAAGKVSEVLAVLLLAGLPVTAQDESPCSAEQSGQFDFWIGDWEVYSGDNLAGTNRVEPILDGCVLQENWVGTQGNVGSSYNFYNPQKKKWQQFWVWRNGTTLELQGSFAEGKMVLEGKSLARDGAEVLNRITWYDNDDGTVRQHWQASRDGGENWQTAFDGMYRKKE